MASHPDNCMPEGHLDQCLSRPLMKCNVPHATMENTNCRRDKTRKTRTKRYTSEGKGLSRPGGLGAEDG